MVGTLAISAMWEIGKQEVWRLAEGLRRTGLVGCRF